MTDPTVTIRTDRRFIRANGRSERFILAHITAPTAETRTERPPVNLAIVLDRSGSMSGVKLETARRAVAEAIGALQATDRFSVVVYDDQVDVVIASTPATGKARRAAMQRLVEIDARGSTDLGGGWFRGCEQVAEHLMEQGINRCLLLTDGLANVGIKDSGELAGHAAALKARGVSTSTFGVGTDFDEQLLTELADAGGGHFYYISDPAQIRDAITSEVGETLEIVARDVALEVLAREGIDVEAITPHKVSHRGGRTSIRLGDLGSEQFVEVVLRLTFPFGSIGQDAGAMFSITDRDGVFAGAGQTRISWEYADSVTNDHQPRDREVDRVVARMFAARATQEAVRLNRQGDYQRASLLLTSTAERIRTYAEHDATLLDEAAELESKGTTFQARMAEPSLKRAYYSSANVARSRTPDGGSVKSPKRG